MTELAFTKMHGLGNDFVVIDARAGKSAAGVEISAAEAAASEGLTVDSASVVAASLRLFSAAVSPPAEDGDPAGRVGAARAFGGDFPVAPLGNFCVRCANLFAFALDDARGVPAAAAAADACSTLATR